MTVFHDEATTRPASGAPWSAISSDFISQHVIGAARFPCFCEMSTGSLRTVGDEVFDWYIENSY